MKKILMPTLSTVLLRARVALLGVFRVFYRPLYIVISLCATLFFAAVVNWSLNLSLVRYIAFEIPLSPFDKLKTLFWDPFWNFYTTYSSSQATSILVFAVLAGANFALLVYVLKHKSLGSIPKKSGFGGTLFAILAGGCAACGTSLLAPLLAPLAASLGVASGALVRDLSALLNWSASLLMIYSIYKLGLLASTIQSEQKLGGAERGTSSKVE